MTKIYTSVTKTVPGNGRFNFDAFRKTFLGQDLGLEPNTGSLFTVSGAASFDVIVNGTTLATAATANGSYLLQASSVENSGAIDGITTATLTFDDGVAIESFSLNFVEIPTRHGSQAMNTTSRLIFYNDTQYRSSIGSGVFRGIAQHLKRNHKYYLSSVYTYNGSSGFTSTKTENAQIDNVNWFSTLFTNNITLENYQDNSNSATGTLVTTLYEFSPSNTSFPNIGAADSSSSQTINFTHVNNLNNSYNGTLSVSVTSSLGATFTLNLADKPPNQYSFRRDDSDGTTYTINSVTFSAPDPDVMATPVKYEIFVRAENNALSEKLTVTSPGTVSLGFSPWGVATRQPVINEAFIASVNVVAEDADGGRIGESLNFQPTPGAQVVLNSTQTVFNAALEEDTTVTTNTVSSAAPVNISLNVNNLDPDENFPDGEFRGTSSGTSVSLNNRPVYHIHQDDDFLTAWQNIATAMTELAAISTTLKGYTESIKNDISVFKALGTNSNQGISTKEVFVNTACRGGGLQPAIVIEALQDAGIWEDVLKELGDPLHMPSGERQSQKDAKNA